MRKLNINNSKYQHCCICFPSDNEVISIQERLLEQIGANLNSPKIQETIEPHGPKNDSLDFVRLIRMIFHRKFKTLQPTSSCGHSLLKKNFLNKLNCKEKQLDRVSGILAWKLGKFHFHTDVVISQSKSFIRHIIKPRPSIRKSPSNNVSIVSSQDRKEEEIKQVKIEGQNIFQNVEQQIKSENCTNLMYFWPMQWPPFGLQSKEGEINIVTPSNNPSGHY